MAEHCLNLCEISPALFKLYDSIKRLFEAFEQKNNISPINRLYVGSAFCDLFFLKSIEPTLEQLFAFCIENNMKITLSVPIFLQNCINQGKEIVKRVIKHYGDIIDEISVNDFGMLQFIKDSFPNYKIRIGRLMNKQMRDPRYPDQNNYSLDDFLKCLPFDSNICGIDLDILQSNLSVDKNFQKEFIGFHSQLSYITTGNICNYKSLTKNISQKYLLRNGCNMECNKLFLMYTAENGIQYYRIGKTVYFRQENCFFDNSYEFRIIHFPFDLWEEQYEYFGAN